MNQKPLELVLRGLLKENGASFVERAKHLLDDIDKHKWYLSEQSGRDIGYDAAVADWNARYGRFENPEIIKIENDYKSGKYYVLENLLGKFVLQNRGLIDQVQKKYSSDKLLALKLLLLKRRSIDMPTEMRMQLDEISREAWYVGSVDRECVARDWAKNHAAGWREHYTLALNFIIEAKKEKFLQLL
jgi:hypothetical protein